MKTLALIVALLAAPAALAQDVAGRFDYYLLSLSWSPSWCRAEGEAEDAEQCDPGARRDFVVHGLWPQHESGWPENCHSPFRNPTRQETQAMADIMGSAGLAWYQWRKHGRCSGLPAQDYFGELRGAAAAVAVPEALRRLARDETWPATAVESAFIAANPVLQRDGVTVTCRGGALQEVRICLTRDLAPRDCAPDTRRDCTGNILLPAPR